MIDDATEEVLHESDAMMALFGQTVENILSERIFEAKRVTKGNSFIEQDEQDAEASIPDKKEEINAIVVEPEETARTVNSDGPAKNLLKTDSAAANNDKRIVNSDERYEGGSNTENTEINNRRDRRSVEEDKQKLRFKVSLETLIKLPTQTLRVKMCDVNRYFQIEAKSCRFK